MMSVTSPKELFTMLLSNIRQGAEQSTKVYSELGQAARNPEIKEALDAREFISNQELSRIDECFKLIGETPVKGTGRLQEVFLEDFRRELAEIQSPTARRVFVLAKVNHLMQLRVAEYMALIAVADTMGRPAVGVLLETCLADRMAFMERARRLIREVLQEKAAAA